MTGPATATNEAVSQRLSWDYARKLTPFDLVAILWAERVTVLSVGAVICALGLVIALMAPRAYTARAELLVRMGQEYVYQPTTAGGAAAGATPDMQSVVNAEMRMLGSGAVVRGTIEQVGLERLYPDIAHGGGSDAVKLAAAERAFAEHLGVETAPQTPAIGLSFSHRDPAIASQALNELVNQYLTHRRDVLVGGEYPALAQQSDDMDTRVAAASEALAKFLSDNQISDFDSELAGLAARAADIETQAFDAEARQRESEARMAALQSQMRTEPEQIELYSESDARRDLVEAQMERQQLLSHYQDDAPPVREVDRRIQQLTAFLAGGDPASVTRRGANPVRQDIASQFYAMQAEARAQRGRGAALLAQRAEVRTRLQRLHELEPQFRQLLRERTILETNAQSFASRAEEARSLSQMLGRSTDNISQVERASPPTQSKSLRMPIALVTIVIAGLAAVAAGLARGLLRQGFPTPAAAARTLDAPVLAVVRRASENVQAKPAPGKVKQKLAKGETKSKPKPALSVVKG